MIENCKIILDIYSIVTTWLINDKQAPHKQQHTARRVYDRLKELYGDEFDASDRSVRKFVADIRKELQMNPDGFLPLEHPPGEAQADFGEARFIENGITKVYRTIQSTAVNP